MTIVKDGCKPVPASVWVLEVLPIYLFLHVW